MGDFEIVPYRKLTEEARHLEFPTHAQAGNLVIRQIRNVTILKRDLPVFGLDLAANYVECRCLSGAVGTNQAAQLAFIDLEIETIDGAEPARIRQ